MVVLELDFIHMPFEPDAVELLDIGIVELRNGDASDRADEASRFVYDPRLTNQQVF